MTFFYKENGEPKDGRFLSLVGVTIMAFFVILKLDASVYGGAWHDYIFYSLIEIYCFMGGIIFSRAFLTKDRHRSLSRQVV